MNGRHWIGSVFRVLAVWLAVETFVTIPGFLASLYSLRSAQDSFPPSFSLYPGAVHIVASVFAATVLWSSSDWLAGLTWRRIESQSSAATISSGDLQTAALRVLGAYLIVVGAPNLAELAAGYYTLPTGFGLDTNYSGHLWARAAGVGFQIAFGAVLLFAARRIVRLDVGSTTSRAGD